MQTVRLEYTTNVWDRTVKCHNRRDLRGLLEGQGFKCVEERWSAHARTNSTPNTPVWKERLGYLPSISRCGEGLSLWVALHTPVDTESGKPHTPVPADGKDKGSETAGTTEIPRLSDTSDVRALVLLPLDVLRVLNNESDWRHSAGMVSILEGKHVYPEPDPNANAWVTAVRLAPARIGSLCRVSIDGKIIEAEGKTFVEKLISIGREISEALTGLICPPSGPSPQSPAGSAGGARYDEARSELVVRLMRHTYSIANAPTASQGE